MSLAPFRYLQRRRVLAFIIVLALSSTLASATSLSLLSFHRGLTLYLSEGEGVVVIYDRASRALFTGLVPAFLADRIMDVNGVLACSPEVIAPCIVRGEPIFLRGVLPGEFLKVSSVTMVDGEALSPKDLSFAMVGRRASEKLGLRVGDRVLVTGVLSPIYLELRVKGVFRSGTALEDEIVAPLHVGQWLRGAKYDHVTIIRVKAKSSVDIQGAILKTVVEDASRTSRPEEREPAEPRIVQWTVTGLKAGDVDVREAERLMEDYLESYGVTRESILVLSLATLIFSGATILLATEVLISQHRGEVEVLRSIGASRKLLRRDLVLKLTPASLLALALGIVTSAVLLSFLLENGLLQVLLHSAQLQVDVLAVILIASTVLAIVAMSAWRAAR